jgi:broad specificity phosphatase PhoE
MIVKQTPQRFANDPRRSETLQARAAELSEKQRESVIAGIQRLVKYEPRPRTLFSSPPSSPVSTSQSAAAASPQRPQLTIQQLRDARNAYFGVGQQQRQNEQQPPRSENGGGGKRKYSRKKNSSKKSKFRRRYSKKYKY